MALFGLTSLSRSSAGSGNAANKGTPDNKSKIRVGSVIAYTHLPGIFPRIRRLGQHFGQFAYLLALIYRSARLIPQGHPFLNGANVGRYGVRDVVATAASNLVMKRENLDQIMIFFAIGAALIMMVLQTLILLFYVAFSGTAQADTGAMFTTPTPATDIVLQFLRNVFGVPNIFGPLGGASIGGVQAALYTLLGFYSTAIMLIAVIIVLYYVVTVVGESAQSGKPFGNRFNGLWAPVRLVLALGLLVPLGTGLNAAQYVTLYMASFGSGLASQGWVLFTSRFGQSEDPIRFMGTTPDISALGAAIFRFEACRALHNQQFGGALSSTNPNSSTFVRIVRVPATRNATPVAPTFDLGDLPPASANASTIRYVWTDTPRGRGDPNPTCGEITISVPRNPAGASGGAAPSLLDAEVFRLQEELVMAHITNIGTIINAISGNRETINPDSAVGKFARAVLPSAGNRQDLSADTRTQIATTLGTAISAAQGATNTAVGNARITGFTNELVEQMKNDARERGWGTAGLYYIEIAKFNQVISDSLSRTVPMYVAPEYNAGNSWVERRVRANITGNENGVSRAVQTVRDGLELNVPVIQNEALSRVNISPTLLGRGGIGTQSFDTSFLANPVLGITRWLFGDAFIRLADAPTLDPMGGLIAGGGQILDKSQLFLGLYIIAKMGAVAAAAVGGMLGLIAGSAAPVVGSIGGAAAGALGAAGLSALLSAVGDVLFFLIIIGLAAGIMLFYVLPLMPFMYFFFAVVNWVIEVVEAVISMPLFALAHLRIDGEGLPGQAAMQGYTTFFGILFRPIIIIIALIFSMLLFGAAVYYLQTIYRFAVFNVRGGGVAVVDFTKIGTFGIMFYLVFYVYIIYLLSSSIFKLIDSIPDGMMRWINAPKSFTGDKTPDIGNFSAITGVMGVQLANQLNSGVSGATKAMREAIPAPKKPPTTGTSGS